MSRTLLLILLAGSIVFQEAHAQSGAEIQGPNELGINETQNFIIDSDASAQNYQWTAPAGCRIISGQGTNSIKLQGTFLSQDGMLTVVRSRENGSNDTISHALTIYRGIDRVEDHTINAGQSFTIDGVPQTEADIYLEQNGITPGGHNLYTAHRLTVIPQDNSPMTKPYLQCVTDSSIWVCWKTSTQTISRVEYGEEALTEVQEGSAEALSNNYFWHSVQLKGLKPNTVYQYRVYNDDGSSDGTVYSFRTAPKTGSQEHLRILLMGDHQIKSRSGYEWLMQAAKRKIEELYGKPVNEAVNFIMNVGDQVDDGVLQQYEQIHLNKSALLSPYLPIMTCVGNHETYHDPGMKKYAAHYHYENMPYKGIESGTENYYAYQIGRVLFVVLSTEHTGSEQKAWVRKVVDAVKEDDSVDFVISVNHRPIQAEQYIGDISSWVRNEIVPILCETPKHVLNYGGHHHLYHRGQLTDYPLYHIINGGASWNQLWGMSSEQDYGDVQKTIDYWGYQILDFDFDKKEMTANCYAIGNKDIVRDNILIDSFRKRLDVPAPHKPAMNTLPEKLELPLSIEGSAYETDSDCPLNTVQIEISTSPNFSVTALNIVRDVENLYGSTGAPLHVPIDKNEGVDITRYTIEKNGLKNGTYYIRMRYRDDNLSWSPWSDVQNFTVEGSLAGDPSIDIAKKVYAPGEAIVVNYQFVPTGQNAWIGLYKKGMRVGLDNSLQWAYTSQENGSQTYTITEPNEYFLALFEDGGYTELQRIPLLVGTAPVLTTDKTHYDVGEPIQVSYKNAPGLSDDWIGVYRMGDTRDPSAGGVTSSSWAYTPKGTTEGSLMLSTGDKSAYKLSKGYYYVGYFTRGGYFLPADSITFSVGDEISTVSAEKDNFKPNEDIIIHYSDGPGTPKDWVGFYEEGKTVGTDELAGFYYTYGATKEFITVPAGEQKAGDYFVALYINDSYDWVSNVIHISVGKAPNLSFQSEDGEAQQAVFSFVDEPDWRDSIYAVYADNILLDETQYKVENGSLAISTANISAELPTHSLTVKAHSWQDNTIAFNLSSITGIDNTKQGLFSVQYSKAQNALLIEGAPKNATLKLYSAEGKLQKAQKLNGTNDVVNIQNSMHGALIVMIDGMEAVKVAVE
jgi:hypothetical protein